MATVSYLYTDAATNGHSFSLGTLTNGLIKIAVSGGAALPSIALPSDSTTNHDYVAGNKYLSQIGGITPAAGGLISNDGTSWSQTTIGANHTVLTSTGTAIAWAGGASSSGNVLTYNGTNIVWAAPATSGTVTSLGITSGDSLLAVSGSPVTTSGSISLSLNTLPTTVGGTGVTSYTGGDISYYASGTALSKLPIGINHRILASTGSAPAWVGGTASTGNALTYDGTNIVWATPLTTGGGTGLTSYTAGDTLFYAGGSTFSKLAIGSAGQLLQVSGSNPAWFTPSYISATSGGGAATIGQATIAALGTTTVVSTTAVTGSSLILLTVAGWTGTATVATNVGISAISSGANFTISCFPAVPGGSTILVNWLIAKA